MSLPNILANGPGNKPDAVKLMDNFYWLLAMLKGTFLSNGGQESWGAGTSFSNPASGAVLSDGWSMTKGGTSGPSIDFSREAADIDSGAYSMQVTLTAGGSSDSYCRIIQGIPFYVRFAGNTVIFGVMVKASTANKVRLHVEDGVTEAVSAFHNGDGLWQKLTVALVVNSVPTAFNVRVEITADFTGDVFMDSGFVYVIESAMSESARTALEYFSPDQGGISTLVYMYFVPQAALPSPATGLVVMLTDGNVYICKDGVNWSIMA